MCDNFFSYIWKSSLNTVQYKLMSFILLLYGCLRVYPTPHHWARLYNILLGLKIRDISLGITRTIAIEKIPHVLCTVDNLYKHFQETIQQELYCYRCKYYKLQITVVLLEWYDSLCTKWKIKAHSGGMVGGFEKVWWTVTIYTTALYCCLKKVF